MKYKAVLFDWEGVMSPYVYGFDRVTKKLAQAGAHPDRIRIALHRTLGQFMRGQITDSDFWEVIEQGIGRSISLEVRRWAWESWRGVEAAPEMLELVENVKQQGIRTVIFSNIIPPCEELIRKTGAYAYFDAEVLSCHVGYAKPEKEIYDIALATAQCEVGECIFIDDRDINLEPARQLGMTTILGDNTQQIKSALEGTLAETDSTTHYEKS